MADRLWVPEVTDLIRQPAAGSSSAAALLVTEEAVERELVELVEALLLAGVEAVGRGLGEHTHMTSTLHRVRVRGPPKNYTG